MPKEKLSYVGHVLLSLLGLELLSYPFLSSPYGHYYWREKERKVNHRLSLFPFSIHRAVGYNLWTEVPAR